MSANKAQIVRIPMSEELHRRITNLEHALFGNGREGVGTRLTRVETILQRIDDFIGQVRLIIIGQVIAFLGALIWALVQ